MSVPATTSRSVALLERAVGYTRVSLAAVPDGVLADATPCAGWSVRDLLGHMDDSLAALTEAAETGAVVLSPLPVDAGADDLVERIRSRACDLLTAWRHPAYVRVRIGATELDRDLLAGIGALEIAVHGWDLARATGAEHPLPDDLAERLLVIARRSLIRADRPGRFGPERPARGTGPGARLLAFVGRDDPGPTRP